MKKYILLLLLLYCTPAQATVLGGGSSITGFGDGSDGTPTFTAGWNYLDSDSSADCDNIPTIKQYQNLTISNGMTLTTQYRGALVLYVKGTFTMALGSGVSMTAKGCPVTNANAGSLTAVTQTASVDFSKQGLVQQNFMSYASYSVLKGGDGGNGGRGVCVVDGGNCGTSFNEGVKGRGSAWSGGSGGGGGAGVSGAPALSCSAACGEGGDGSSSGGTGGSSSEGKDGGVGCGNTDVGWPGGAIVIVARNVAIAAGATIRSDGGNGESGSDGGGGAGGGGCGAGYCLILYKDNYTNNGNSAFTAGSAGAGTGSGGAGVAGSAGSLTANQVTFQ